MTQKEFETELLKIHKQIVPIHWSNYPNSVFYYPSYNFDNTTKNIGIWTNEKVYHLGTC